VYANHTRPAPVGCAVGRPAIVRKNAGESIDQIKTTQAAEIVAKKTV
jgi:hypothetical protein